MEQLSTADQGKVDELNDAIRRLTQENKEAFSARMNLEATKNKLENLLTNNLIRFVEFFFWYFLLDFTVGGKIFYFAFYWCMDLT